LFVKFGGYHAVKSVNISFEIRSYSDSGVTEEPSLLRCDDVSMGKGPGQDTSKRRNYNNIAPLPASHRNVCLKVSKIKH